MDEEQLRQIREREEALKTFAAMLTAAEGVWRQSEQAPEAQKALERARAAVWLAVPKEWHRDLTAILTARRSA